MSFLHNELCLTVLEFAIVFVIASAAVDLTLGMIKWGWNRHTNRNKQR